MQSSAKKSMIASRSWALNAAAIAFNVFTEAPVGVVMIVPPTVVSAFRLAAAQSMPSA
jgi:hypothetical protein